MVCFSSSLGWRVQERIGICLLKILCRLLSYCIFGLFKFLQRSHHKIPVFLFGLGFVVLHLSLNFKLLVKLPLSFNLLFLYFLLLSLFSCPSFFNLPLKFLFVRHLLLLFGSLQIRIFIRKSASDISCMGFLLI